MMRKNNLYDPSIYQQRGQYVLGFHGCDKNVAMRILNSKSEHLTYSRNDYDWLGSGVYFWENDPVRAYEWAEQSQKRNPEAIKVPFVIGAVIELKCCLNLCERQSIAFLRQSYNELDKVLTLFGKDIRQEYCNYIPDEGGFNLKRPLDCTIINLTCNKAKMNGLSFDTVYGYFQEGKDAFEGSGIKEKSHIQICVRNTDCIKGYFLPRIK